MVFYKVTSRYYGHGKTEAEIEAIESEKQPKNEFISTAVCDTYYDYFESYERAQRAYTDAKNG